MTGIRLTLYKNCILNDKYKNVFSQVIAPVNYNPFISYLSSLVSKQFDLDEVYSDELTSFTFYLSTEDYNSIYDFNYMKIESISDNTVVLTRYAFIRNIKIGNEVAIVSYKLDIWHSFSTKIKGINYSFVNGLRVVNIGDYIEDGLIANYRKLPVSYDGNNKLKITSLIRENENDDNVYLLLELQTYDIVSGTDEKSYRSVEYVIVRGSANVYYNSINTAETLVQNLILHIVNGTANGHNYEVGNIYFIPKDLINESDFINEKVLKYDNGGTMTSFGTYKTLVLSHNNSEVYSGTISNNYKNIAIGTYNSKIKLVNNGSDIDFTVKLYETDAGISLLLNCQNQIIDILDDFKYEIPFSSIRAEEFTQRKINTNLEKKNLSLELDEGKYWFRIAGDVLSSIQSLMHLRIGSGFKEFTSGMYEYPLIDYQKTKNILEAVQSKQYSNSKSILSNNNNAPNYLYGLVLLQIEPDNENYVKETINNYGHIVYEYINDISKLGIFHEGGTFRTNGIYYNTIKFEFADVYGSFPDYIANELNKILENGIKIWYWHNIDYALEHDTYAIG